MSERSVGHEPPNIPYNIELAILNASSLVGADNITFVFPDPEKVSTNETMAAYLEKTIQEGLEEGDILVFNSQDEKYSNGVYLANGKIVYRPIRRKIYEEIQLTTYSKPKYSVAVNGNQLNLSIEETEGGNSHQQSISTDRLVLTKRVFKERVTEHGAHVTIPLLEHKIIWPFADTGNTGKE